MRRTISVLLVVLVLAVMPSVALAYEWGQYDLGGNTVSFVINWDILTSYFGPEATYAPGRLEEAEKLFNCKFEWVNSGGSPDEIMNARLLAGESAYDFWAVGLSTSRFFQNAAAGWYCPVTNVIPQEYYDELPVSDRSVMDSFSFRGEKYAIAATDRTSLTSFFIWNKTMFKENGWPMLDELYLKDEFTWDVVTEIALQATKDFDGDGVIDQWGLGIIPPHRFVIGTGGKEVEFRDGKYVFAMDSPESLAALNQVVEWNKLGVHHGYWSNELFATGTVAMSIAESWMLLGWPIFMHDRDFEIGILPYPRRADADRYIFPADTVATYVLPANCAQPEAMVALLNFLMPWEERYEFTIDDWMASIGQDPISYEVAYNAAYNWTGECNLFWWDLMSSGSPLSEVFWSDVMGGARTPASIFAEYKDAIQAQLDDVLGQ